MHTGLATISLNTPLSCMSCERWQLLPQSLSTTVLDGNGLKAVVFAAGFGKRLAPLTASRPKHVLPLAGKPIVRHVVEALFEAGVSEVGITIGYMGEKVVKALEDLRNITYITQQDIRGTGQALRECRSFLAGEQYFYVVYGDVTVSAGILEGLRSFCEDGGFDGALVAVEKNERELYGSVISEHGKLVRIGEKTGEPGVVNAGIYFLGQSVYEVLGEVGISPRGEVELTDALNLLAARGRGVGVYTVGGDWWFDIGRPADYLKANIQYLHKLCGNRVIVSEDVELGRGVVLKGPLYIGGGVRIGDGCVLEGPVMVCEGSVVDEESLVSSTVILEECYIGPQSRLRNAIVCEGSRLSAGVVILSDGFPAYVIGPGSVVDHRLEVV
jgi:NDP-sugar pyrophosphorylase family protein